MKEFLIILNILFWIAVVYFLHQQNFLPWFLTIIIILIINHKEIIITITGLMYWYKQIKRLKEYRIREKNRRMKAESKNAINKAFY